ncbi:putative histone-lysine n-methyltransferase [Operophtera brumata]|uniref:Putative histone-lysine n-methyltransferase n=1 Tax=Operophtera brumata TaxID=104452 RepID=A0A0L7LET2_OPEBR|nr:putative histone-lysine n-methyltransferase [Operophtera brumata]
MTLAGARTVGLDGPSVGYVYRRLPEPLSSGIYECNSRHPPIIKKKKVLSELCTNDGLNEGDEYLAELDYIEVVEGMKEGYEDDVPDADKRLDKKSSDGSSGNESEPTSSESEDEREQSAKDGDFQPGYIPYSNIEFKKSLRKRQKLKKKEEKEKQKADAKKRDDCITISDDEEGRWLSRATLELP